MSDMEADMQETLDAMRQRDAEVEEVIEEIENQDDDLDVVEETTDGPARDEKGRFAPKAEPNVAEEAPEPDQLSDAPSGEDDIEQPVSEDAPEPVAPELINAPDSWTAEAKSKYAELPEWAKREVHKREGDMANGVGQLKERASFGDRISQTIQPYMPIIQAEGGTPESVVGTMLNVAYTLRQGTMQERLGLIASVAQQYGFYDQLAASFTNPQDVANSPNSGQNNQVANDPRVDQIERMLLEQRQQEQQRIQNEALQAVQDFVTATNDDGTRKYPYYENVREHMADLYETGRYESLEAAYDAAVWANPETRNLVQAQQSQAQQAEQSEKAKERARKAQNADKLNVSKTGTHPPKQQEKPTGSVEDTMREEMEKIRSRTA